MGAGGFVTTNPLEMAPAAEYLNWNSRTTILEHAPYRTKVSSGSVIGADR